MFLVVMSGRRVIQKLVNNCFFFGFSFVHSCLVGEFFHFTPLLVGSVVFSKIYIFSCFFGLFMDRDGGVGLIFLFGLLVCVVVFFVVYLLSPGVDDVVFVGNFSGVVFDVNLGCDGVGLVSYEVSNSSGVVRRGVMFDGVVERLGGVSGNSSVLLSGWSDVYYFNETSCFVSKNNSFCVVGLARKDFGYDFFLNGSGLGFVVGDGVVQSPLVCFGWDYRLNNLFLSGFDRVGVPGEFGRDVDACYRLGSLFNDSFFPVDFHRNSLFNDSASVLVVVEDFERDGFSNIGVRRGVFSVG